VSLFATLLWRSAVSNKARPPSLRKLSPGKFMLRRSEKDGGKAGV
jgi:hypothetical protein